MIGICVISHGSLASGLKDSCELILGEQTQFLTVGLRDGDDFDEFKESALNSIKEVNHDKGVLVFVDLFGASPYNSVLFSFPELISSGIDVRMITGVNLPMIIEACDKRMSLDLDELFYKVIHSGKEYIIGMDDKLNQTL